MSPERSQFLPGTSIKRLEQRAQLLGVVRRIFAEHGYWEVETPQLSHGVIADSHMEPFSTFFAPEGTNPELNTASVLYLQPSPELGMKRLLVAGADSIYQINRAFRNGEVGRFHNPEFTMLEWYRVGATYHDQMTFVETLVREVFRTGAELEGESTRPAWLVENALESPQFERLTYDAAFERFAGCHVRGLAAPALAELAHTRGVSVPPGLLLDDRDGWLNLLLADLVEPRLGEACPEFLYDYPASQSALARIRADDPPVAERFELYVGGIEVCNGYQELTDAEELRERMKHLAELRRNHGRHPLPRDKRLLAAMKAGLPECSGVALGLDRLFMLAVGASSISEVMAFGFERS